MTYSLADLILGALDNAAIAYYRLVLAVGPPRSGKTGAISRLSKERGWPRLNVSLQLAERLLELTEKQRAIRVGGMLAEYVANDPADVILLDNIELLFATQLAQDPLRLLQALSRNRTIVATWPGSFENDILAHAEPGHPEARRYASPEAIIVLAQGAHSTEAAGAPEDVG